MNNSQFRIHLPNEDVNFHQLLPSIVFQKIVDDFNKEAQKIVDANPELYVPYPSSHYSMKDDLPGIMRPIPKNMKFDFQLSRIEMLTEDPVTGT